MLKETQNNGTFKIIFDSFLPILDFTEDLLMRSLVTSHTTSLYVMPEVSQLTICGDRLNRASSVFLDSPVKPWNDKNVVLLMNSLVYGVRRKQ